MKTAKIFTAIAILSFALFLSLASSAKADVSNTGDLPNAGTKSLRISSTANADFNYLHFDVTDFIVEEDGDKMVMPVVNEFEYLRFDVNNFVESNPDKMIELPVNEFDYLRFDVNSFSERNADSITELPVNEFDYLRFDVNRFMTTGNNSTDQLPALE